MTRPWCVLSFCVLCAAGATGCASRSARVATPAPNGGLQASYIDLQPGWRLRVITPLTKSGMYQLGPVQQQEGEGSITLAATDDFVGYETSFYRVQPRGRRGVRIQLAFAEETKNGVTSTKAVPLVELFKLSPRAENVRLLYLTRASQSNHNMAVIAAANAELLAQKTVEVETDPRGCQNGEQSFCSWIPAGIAVRPEMRGDYLGAQWESAPLSK